MESKRIVWFLLIILLGIFSFILIKYSHRNAKPSSQVVQSNLTSLPLNDFNSKPFKIVSSEMTQTGQIVHAMKNGVEKRAFIPKGMSIPSNVLEATLFGQPTIPSQPNHPSDVLNSDLLFYGLVMDENSNIVAEANIDTSVLVMAPGQNANPQTRSLISGKDGRFFIDTQWGQQIMVKVAKPNYIDTPWQTFRYGNIGGIEPKYYPDPNNPAVFILHTKTNSASLFSFNKVFGLPHDGNSVQVDLTTGQIVLEGGDLIISVNCPEPYTNLKKIPWEVSVSVIDGGLIEAHPINNQIENMQDAPSSGYSKGFDLKYDASSPNYRRQLDSLYYISSRNGQVYSKVRINMTTYWDERGIPFGIEAYVNTSGSRNLQNVSQ